MIISIGKVEWHDLQRRLTLPKQGQCEHNRLQYIEHGEMLKCRDCNEQVTAVWALKHFFTNYMMAKERLEAIRSQIEADEKRLVLHRAALAVQDAWRKKHLVPCCPHCNKGILPLDGFGKKTMVNPNYYHSEPLRMKPNLEAVAEEK